MTRPVTPDMLAERWACSDETVRQMIKRGELRAFRVGRMFRIPWEAVEEVECKSASEDLEGGSASIGMTPQQESDGAISLRHATERKQRGRR